MSKKKSKIQGYRGTQERRVSFYESEFLTAKRVKWKRA
jgi:hypothetical protein